MGEAVQKLSGKLGIDTTDFKTGLAAANRELRVLESGFRASASALNDWTQDAGGLEDRISSLTEKIDIQKLKVEALRENYEEMVRQNGENSRAAQDAEIQLNKETQQLNEMQKELAGSEQALQDLATAENEAGDSANTARDKMEDFKKVMGGIGEVVAGTIKIVAGLAGAVAGVGLAIGKLVFDTATASAELVDLSAKTGISTERLQEMEYIGEQVGTSQDTIVSSMARLVRSMGSAQQQQADFNQDREEALAAGEEFDGQLGDTASAFDKLGVKVTDAGGKLRDNEAVFADVITALGRIPNEAERDALSMELFGKSAQELNPLIKAGSAEMARLAQESHEVGAVMSGENVAAFEELDDTVASLKAGLKGTLGTLAASFLPGFQSLFDELGGYLKGFKGIVESSDGDIAKMAEGIGKLAARIVSDIAAQAPQLLQTGVVILQSIVQSLISALPSLIPAAIEIVVSLLEFILDNLPLLVEAALQAVIALANGLSEALPRLIPAIIEALILIVNTIVENLPLLVEAATQLILGLTKGILIALPILIEALPQVIEAIVLALIEAAPLLLSAAGQLLGMLAAGIVLAIPQVLVAIGDLIYRLGLALAEFWEQAPEIGKALIQGLWQGIVDAVPFFLDNLRTFGNKVVNEFQSIFGVQSPSTVFADDIGKYLLPGLTKGVENSIPSARRQLEQTISALTNNLQLGLPGIGTNVPQTSLAGAAAGSVTNSNTSNQNVTINISATVRGQQDIDYMAQEVARRIAKP